MRLVKNKHLVEGMILALDVYADNNLLVSKGTVLTKPSIDLLRKSVDSTYIYELKDVKELLNKNHIVSENYMGYILDIIYKMFQVALYDEKAFEEVSLLVKNILITNRDILYQLFVINNKHPYTFSHSINVTMYSLMIGLNLDLTSRELIELIIGGIFHDIGKLKISNKILDKTTALTDKEFNAIKSHPIYGFNTLEKYGYLTKSMLDITIQHHEKLDGSGYPFGLTSDHISFLSKIVTVADIFDASISERSYHSSRTAYKGVSFLTQDARDGKIDLNIVNALIAQIYMFKKGNYVKLNNGDFGRVLKDCKGFNPIVQVQNGQIVDLASCSNLSII